MPQRRVGLGTRFGRDGGCGWVSHLDFFFFFFFLQKSVHFFLSIFAFFPPFLPIYFNHEPRGYEPRLLYIFHLIFF